MTTYKLDSKTQFHFRPKSIFDQEFSFGQLNHFTVKIPVHFGTQVTRYTRYWVHTGLARARYMSDWVHKGHDRVHIIQMYKIREDQLASQLAHVYCINIELYSSYCICR